MELPGSLGPYRLLRRLGHGGMAEVFLAEAYGASGFEKRVALKTLLPELQGDGEYERILVAEARLGARLTHRNLVQVHDLGAARGTYYVRMDYIDGADLDSLLRGRRGVEEARPMPPPLALRVACEVCEALAYLHRVTDDDGHPLGLVHRDVSPSNILVSRDGEVKLADYGIAKATLRREDTRGGVARGKYAYMSPEQAVGGALTARSDQFGLGVTLCEMLTGRRPFDGATPLDTLDRVREALPPALPELDQGLRAIALRCFQRDPAARYPRTEDLSAALDEARRALGASPTEALAAWVGARLAERAGLAHVENPEP
ncbi:MAG: serine/threonine protein kinase [Deltaproteobacteria bacterium]|nr:serine/threonine protein kinase [Deltaproteobacteria bacterium]